MARSSIRLLVFLIFFVIGLTVVINATIDTPYFHKLAGNRINQRLGQVIPGATIEFQSINLQLMPPTVNLYGFRVKDKNEEELVEVSHAKAAISLSSLFFIKPKLSLVELTDIDINLPFPKLTTNQGSPGSQASEKGILWPPETNLPIENLVIRDANINWLLNADIPSTRSSFMSAKGLNLALNFKDWRSWAAEINLAQLNFIVEGAQLVQDTSVSLKLFGKNDKILGEDLRVLSKQLNASGSLGLDFELERAPLNLRNKRIFTDYLRAFHLKSNIDIKQADMGILGEFLKAPDSDGFLDGNILVQASVPLAEQELEEYWRITGKARSFHARLAGFKLLESDINFTVKNDAFIFDHIDIHEKREMGAALATGQGIIGFDSDLPLRFLIKPQGLGLSSLLNILKVEGADFISTELYSEKLLLEGNGNPLSLKLSGDTIFNKISTPQLADFADFPDRPSCRFPLDLQIDSNQVVISESKGTCYIEKGKKKLVSSPLNLAANISYDTETGMNLTVNSPEFDLKLAEHFAKIPLNGQAIVSSKLEGPYSQLVSKNKLRAKQLTIFNLPARKIDSSVTVNLSEKSISPLNLSLLFEQSGSLNMSESRLDLDQLTLRTNLNIKKLSENFITKLFKQFTTGSVPTFALASLDGKVSLPLLEPLAANTNLTLLVENVKLNEELIADKVSGRLIADNDTVQTKNLEIKKGQLLNKLSYLQRRLTKKDKTTKNFLGLDLNDEFKLVIATSTIEQSSPKEKKTVETKASYSIPYVGNSFSTANVGFNLELNATLEGSFLNYEGGFGSKLSDIEVFGSAMAPFQITGFVSDGKISIPLLRQSGNALVARFNMDLTRESLPYSLVAYLDQFDIRAFLSPLFAGDPRNYAYLSAEADLTGTLKDFFNSRGTLNFKRFRGQFFKGSDSNVDKIALASDDAIRVDLSPKSWSFQGAKTLGLYSDKLSLSLSLNDNDPPEYLNIVGDGGVDLTILKDIFPTIETAQGQLDFKFKVTGSIDDPSFNFNLEDRKLDPFDRKKWQPLAIGFVDMNPAITNIESKITLTDNVLYIAKLKGNKGRNGRINITGKVDFTSDAPSDSQLRIDMNGIQMDRISIPLFKTANATVSGNLSLIGREAPLQLNGNIIIDEASSITDFDLRKQIISSIRRSQAAPPVLQSEPILNLDLTVTSSDAIKIKNRNLDVQLLTNLSITGNEDEPIVLGQIETVKGTFTYRRDFDIQRSFISFEESVFPPDPRLDIVGQAEIPSEGVTYEVTIIINGKASDPRVSLSIDPPTKPDGTAATKLDILVLLTTGRMRNLGGPSGDTLQNEALLLLAGYAETPLEKIFDLTGQQYIRQIYFDSYLPPATDDEEAIPIPRANLPITLTDDLNIILQYDQNENIKGLFQYSLNEKITVSGSFDPSQQDANINETQNLPADTGVDLQFRFSFE